MKEKISFFNSRGIKIVGDFYKSSSDKGVIMCHGFTGDRHEAGKYDLLSEKLQKKGYNCLTFDFSGSGESDDEVLNTNNQAEDFRDALKWMKEKGIRQFGVVAMSLGPIAVLKNKKLFGKEIKSIVFWCPVTYKKDNYALYKFSKEQLEELGTKGYITHTKVRQGRPRQTFRIDKQIIDERENIKREELLADINLPLHIIHGDKDESVPLNWSKESLNYLPKNSTLEVINGASHSFRGYEEELLDKTISWITINL
jgi:esterase/lipase